MCECVYCIHVIIKSVEFVFKQEICLNILYMYERLE